MLGSQESSAYRAIKATSGGHRVEEADPCLTTISVRPQAEYDRVVVEGMRAKSRPQPGQRLSAGFGANFHSQETRSFSLGRRLLTGPITGAGASDANSIWKN